MSNELLVSVRTLSDLRNYCQLNRKDFGSRGEGESSNVEGPNLPALYRVNLRAKIGGGALNQPPFSDGSVYF